MTTSELIEKLKEIDPMGMATVTICDAHEATTVIRKTNKKVAVYLPNGKVAIKENATIIVIE